jgi:hypothetical protein
MAGRHHAAQAAGSARHAAGVFVQRFKEPEEEHGVFIAFPDSRVSTEPDQNPSFTLIDGQAYTYTVRPVKRD